MQKKKVLFIGMGNSARSQMAEAFMRRYAGSSIEAFSAGFEPKPMEPIMVKVMKEIGIDMGLQYPKPITAFNEYMNFTYVITVCGKHDKYCPAFFPGKAAGLHWDLDELENVQGKEEEKLEKFREIRDQIQKNVLEWLGKRGITIEHWVEEPGHSVSKANTANMQENR